jgi:hypothetical protein
VEWKSVLGVALAGTRERLQHDDDDYDDGEGDDRLNAIMMTERVMTG